MVTRSLLRFFYTRTSARASRRGQSLAELLVGLGIGAIFIVGAATFIAPSLQTTKQIVQTQTESELANAMVSNIRVWAAGNWDSVNSLATTSAYTYYLSTATSSFVTVGTGTSTESIVIATTTYIRYFYLNNVYRDSSGNPTSTTSLAYDPSTKLVTVVVNISGASSSTALTTSMYITRNQSNIFNQTSWIGGGIQSTSSPLVTNAFASSTDISVNASGSIELLGSSGNSCVY